MLPQDHLRPGGRQRDWGRYDEKLVNRGRLAWMFQDTSIFKAVSKGPKGGRPEYPAVAYAVCMLVRASDNLDWRTTEGKGQ